MNLQKTLYEISSPMCAPMHSCFRVHYEFWSTLAKKIETVQQLSEKGSYVCKVVNKL